MSNSNGWIGNWNVEFLGPKKGLGMELEYRKFHVELYSHSGIQGGFPTLQASDPPRLPWLEKHARVMAALPKYPFMTFSQLSIVETECKVLQGKSELRNAIFGEENWLFAEVDRSTLFGGVGTVAIVAT